MLQKSIAKSKTNTKNTGKTLMIEKVYNKLLVKYRTYLRTFKTRIQKNQNASTPKPVQGMMKYEKI